jgi:hypothetical protein
MFSVTKLNKFKEFQAISVHYNHALTPKTWHGYLHFWNENRCISLGDFCSGQAIINQALRILEKRKLRG